MKHTKEQIESIAKKILKKTKFSFDQKEPIMINEIEDFHHIGKTIKAWNVSVFFGKEDWGRNQIAGLVIGDEDGNPIYLQHSLNSFIYYQIDKDGNISSTTQQGSR